jgi:hypothetical protein
MCYTADNAVAQTLEDGMDELRDRGGGSVTSDDDCGCELLRAIVDNLKDPSLAWIEEQINGIITEVCYYCCCLLYSYSSFIQRPFTRCLECASITSNISDQCSIMYAAQHNQVSANSITMTSHSYY